MHHSSSVNWVLTAMTDVSPASATVLLRDEAHGSSPDQFQLRVLAMVHPHICELYSEQSPALAVVTGPNSTPHHTASQQTQQCPTSAIYRHDVHILQRHTCLARGQHAAQEGSEKLSMAAV